VAVVIRLRRGGMKKKPIYRIIATDSRFPRDGRFLEVLGQYNPLPEKEFVNIDKERMLYWLGVGAQPTEIVKKLLSRNGLWQKFQVENKIKASTSKEASEE